MYQCRCVQCALACSLPAGKKKESKRLSIGGTSVLSECLVYVIVSSFCTIYLVHIYTKIAEFKFNNRMHSSILSYSRFSIIQVSELVQ